MIQTSWIMDFGWNAPFLMCFLVSEHRALGFSHQQHKEYQFAHYNFTVIWRTVRRCRSHTWANCSGFASRLFATFHSIFVSCQYPRLPNTKREKVWLDPKNIPFTSGDTVFGRPDFSLQKGELVVWENKKSFYQHQPWAPKTIKTYMFFEVFMAKVTWFLGG